MQNQQVTADKGLGEIVKRVLGLALPMAWSRFIQMFGWFIGMLIVAHISKDVLAASALINATQIAICVIYMSLLFSMGVVAGRLFGEGNDTEVGALFQQGILLSLLLGSLMMATCFYIPHLLTLTGQPANLVAISERYLHAFAWTSFPLMLLVAAQQLCYGILKQRLVIINNIISLFVFIPATYVFSFGGLGIHAMGVIGLAYAMLLQASFNLITLSFSIYYSRGVKKYKLFKRHNHKNLRHIKQLFSVGWPMSAQFGGELIAFFSLTIFTGWLGDAALSATQITQQVVLLFLVPLFAVAESAGILVSQAIGAKEYDKVKLVGNVCILVGVVGVILFSTLFTAIPHLLTAMYINVNDPANATTVKLARWLFYLSGPMLLFDTMRNLYSGALRGFYDTKYPMWIGLIALWVLCVPLGYVFGFNFHWGVIGIRAGTILGFVIATIILWRRWEFQTSKMLESC